jgi:antibiotic biosynthesis monooxygenase (ABM) superfamily enzyme
MFAVIYSFQVKKDSQKEFEESWKEMTCFIRKFEGGLGSRLHKKADQTYIAYAQWPDRITWLSSGGNLPEESYKYREIMKNSCNKIETLHELEMVNDLLVKDF